MSLSLAHTTTPTSNGWIRGAILTVDGIIFNCRDHEYGRYRGLESHKGAVFLVFLFSVSWLGFIVARGWSLGQRNGGVPTWVDPAGIDPRDQTQGI